MYSYQLIEQLADELYRSGWSKATSSYACERTIVNDTIAHMRQVAQKLRDIQDIEDAVLLTKLTG